MLPQLVGIVLAVACTGRANESSAPADAGTSDGDADAHRADTCVRASEDAICCQGASYDKPATVCGGMPCTLHYYCSGGFFREDGDDCFFRSMACTDSGGADEEASGD
jgi:hypothetical protein